MITPPRTPTDVPPLILKIEVAYTLWHSYILHFPKIHRYSLGAKIDSLLCEIICYISSALFVKKEHKVIHIQKAIQLLDTVKILLKVANKVDALDTKKFTALSEKLFEIGRMLGGWHNQALAQNEKENSRAERGRKE